jgi:NAD(P)-dependent dehydrogenase (short-subunit alcohol dehydrogenase family)|tara:strand:- start:907 stop:1647 length:741 start_codon:yes stop_codon:yes gene_type:complete
MFKNNNILITGVGKGIGKELLIKCIKNNYFVYGICRSRADYKDLLQYKNNSSIFFGDVTNEKFLKRIFSHFKKKKIFFKGLVNNAGERQRIEFDNLNKKKLLHIFNTNFFSIVDITQKFIKHNKINNYNLSVVNIGSIVGHRGFSHLSGYASTKSALEGLTKSLSIEFAEKKIRFNTVNPGFTKTSFYKKFKLKRRKLYNWTISRIPMKRWANTEEVTELICFLLSDNSSYITGQSINIDGGWTAQ